MLSYDNELEIPFDVLRLDGFDYGVPHGLHLSSEAILKEGVFELELVNRNVTLSPLFEQDKTKHYGSLSFLPADEFLLISGTRDRVVIYSSKLLNILGMTVEAMYNFYSKYDKRLDDVDPSQITVERGRMCIGSIAQEEMIIVWTGADFIVTPAAGKLRDGERAVITVEGALTAKKFRCKYGMLDYRPA